MNNVMKDFTFSTVPEIIVEWAGTSRAGEIIQPRYLLLRWYALLLNLMHRKGGAMSIYLLKHWRYWLRMPCSSPVYWITIL